MLHQARTIRTAYRPPADTGPRGDVKTVTSPLAVHTPAMVLPITSKTTVLASDPDFRTSASPRREPDARPAPRLKALTAIHRPHFALSRRSTSHCANPVAAPPSKPMVPKLTARAATPSIRKLSGPPTRARPVCSTSVTPRVRPTAIPNALATIHHQDDDRCRRTIGH